MPEERTRGESGGKGTGDRAGGTRCDTNRSQAGRVHGYRGPNMPGPKREITRDPQ